MIDPR